MNDIYFISEELCAKYTNDSINEGMKNLVSELAISAESAFYKENPFLALVKERAGVTFSSCQHEYKQYQGFSDTFEYCTKCDGKRG